jgi:hypothetical protein
MEEAILGAYRQNMNGTEFLQFPGAIHQNGSDEGDDAAESPNGGEGDSSNGPTNSDEMPNNNGQMLNFFNGIDQQVRAY